MEVISGPVFEGNTYLQIRSLPVLENMTQGTRFYASDENVLSAIGDETGTVISLE